MLPNSYTVVVLAEPPVFPHASSMERPEMTQSELRFMAKAKLRSLLVGTVWTVLLPQMLVLRLFMRLPFCSL